MRRSALALSLLLVVGCEQKKENVVAEVNGEKILAEAFAGRYTKLLSSGGQRDNILLRQKILNNMVNERLIFADCAKQGFDSDAQYRRRIEEIESQAFVDEYTKRITIDTIAATEPELHEEFRNYNTTVRARYLYAETEEAALQLKESLQRGATFDQLARDIFEDPGLASNGGDVGYFGWSDMEPAFEEAAYSLPINTMSEPIRMNVGFGIVQVLDRKLKNPLASELDYAKAKTKLERAIIQKKSMRTAREAAFTIVEEMQADFNAETVSLVLKNWRFIADESFTEARPTFADTLASLPLVRFKDASWTVGDVLTRAVKTTPRQRRYVKSEREVKEFVKGLALRDEMLKRARGAGVHDDVEVKNAISQRREDFLLKRWMLSVRDTVGKSGWDETVMRSRYELFKKEYAFPPEVNVAEILVRTKTDADKILARLASGADFAGLAQQHSLRRSTAKKGGAIGWGTRATFGNMSEKFFAGKVGAILGPEFVDPYYGIFKILGETEGTPKTFEEAKELIAVQLASGKKIEVVERAVNNLRSPARIQIHNEILANVVINQN